MPVTCECASTAKRYAKTFCKTMSKNNLQNDVQEHRADAQEQKKFLPDWKKLRSRLPQNIFRENIKGNKILSEKKKWKVPFFIFTRTPGGVKSTSSN